MRDMPPARGWRERYPAPIVHVIVLAALTAATNASALSPGLFGKPATMPLAIFTLLAAGLEHIVRRWWMVRGPLPDDPERTRAILRVHAWGCGLAATVAVVCALWTAFR